MRYEGAIDNGIIISKHETFFTQGGPIYGLVLQKAIIYSVHVRDATNSEPYVAVSQVARLLEYQPNEVLLWCVISQ